MRPESAKIRRGKISKKEWQEIRRLADMAREAAEEREAAPPRLPKFLLYRRCSHESSVKSGIGLEVQRDQAEAYMRLLLVTNPQIPGRQWFVDEEVSGQIRFAHRPAGRELHKEVQPGDHIIFACFDRAFRNTLDALQMMELWKRREINVHFADLRCDLDTAQGAFLMTIVAACSQWEAQRTSERNKATAAKMRALNRPATSAPIGKKIHTGHDGEKRYVWDWEARRIARKIVRLREAGHYWWDISEMLELEFARKEKRPPVRTKWGRKFGAERCRRYYLAEMRYQEQAAAKRNSRRNGSEESEE